MSNSCFDPGADDGAANPAFDLLADPFRRRLLAAAVLTIGGGVLGTLGVPLPSLAASAGRAAGALHGFTGIPVSTSDSVTVPAGFSARLLYAWGDPVSDGPRARADAGDDAASQMLQAGMHHDGMHFFPFIENGKASSTHGLLCINHEYTDDGLLHPGGMQGWSAEKVAKSKAAHGISVIEVRQENGAWQVVRPSALARRITADTACRISGPARGHPAMCTTSDRRGERVLGTVNNCAMGVTPWGTYLSCEENFNGYFSGPPAPAGRPRGRGRWNRARAGG